VRDEVESLRREGLADAFPCAVVDEKRAEDGALRVDIEAGVNGGRRAIADPEKTRRGPHVAALSRSCSVGCYGLQTGFIGSGLTHIGRIISLSSCERMWQCHTYRPGMSK
jgi:hypothetical protein